MATAPADATALKAEGNALYIAKDFQAAHAKYDAAIKLDTENAILYANRAACSLSMNKFADAVVDCKKAVALDPKYTKAWTRLGAALQKAGRLDEALRAYKDGLRSLPPTAKMTATDYNLKAQCEEGMSEIQARMDKIPRMSVISDAMKDQMPWKRAQRMEERLFKATNIEDMTSSAWVISEAYQEFQEGLNLISQVRKIPNGPGKYQIMGHTAALSCLTNGILRDPRVFHIENPGEFSKKYDLQMEMEVSTTKAWPPMSSSAQLVIEQAQQRQKAEGWDSVRPALSTTIRIWIMKAIVAQSVEHDFFRALDLWDRAIEVLEWGRTAWKDVPAEQRGNIFAATFLVGVKNLRIETLMMANTHYPEQIPLDRLHDAAWKLIEATDELEEPQELEPGFALSFFVYPKAHAYAVLGLYYRHLADIHEGANEKMAHECFHQSGAAYKKAALLYPTDDEFYGYYLICALDMLYLCTGTANAFLDIMEKIRLSIPRTKEIWEHSTLFQDLHRKFSEALGREKNLRRAIASGRVKKETVLRGPELKPVA